MVRANPELQVKIDASIFWLSDLRVKSTLAPTGMADDEDNPQSPTSSTDSDSSSRSSTVLPEALVHGREKRATAGNKLRALLDAEFQEEEIFKEDEDDEEFERQKSEEGEDFLTESESSGDEDVQDEEEGEKALIAQQKSEAKKRKRKANEAFSKPAPKRRIPPKKENVTTISKPASTASSISNRRISFDPTLLSSRRSSRALTVQTTNETHSRIISAAARRATLPVIQRRERTPPLTQDERLAQAVLTEQENKLSLKRIVEAEEERARKRREKLEALRRRRFDEPILRFISRRQALIEEIPANEEEDILIVDDGDEKVETGGEIEVKQEPTNVVKSDAAKDKQEAKVEDENATNVPMAQEPGASFDESTAGQDMTTKDKAKNATVIPVEAPPSAQNEQQSPISEGDKPVSPPAPAEEKMDIDQDGNNDVEPGKTAADTSSIAVPPQTNVSACDNRQHADSMQEIKTNDGSEANALLSTVNGTQAPELVNDANEVYKTTESVPEAHLHESHTNHTTPPPATSPSVPKSSPKITQPETPPPPKTPPPYHEAHYTANTLSFVSLPGSSLQSTRDTFFPDVPLIPPPKPKPSARCPITGLPARYKDPLSGVGYYDIHAFKILREVGRKGSRYVWCSEGGWFVGETGWGGRAAKGVPEGWNG